MISKIIILNKSDLSQVNEVTEIHKNVLGFSALSNLGLPFLSRFYKSILSKESQKIITINQGIVLGFISLSFTNQSYLSSLKLTDILYLCIQLIKKPYILSDIIKLILNSHKLHIDEAEISQFAVTHNSQSYGLGSKLLKNVNILAKKNKKNRMITMTHNKKLINYYIRNFKAEIFKEIKLFKQNYYLIKWKL